MQERNLVSVELSADDKKLKITRVMPKDKETIDNKSQDKLQRYHGNKDDDIQG